MEGGQPTHANDCMPVPTNTVTPLAVNHTSPSFEFKVVLPFIPTSKVNVVPLTTAEAAGVSTSYLDSESTSFCTRLTVLPTSCFSPMVVEPVPARLSSLMSISVSGWTSIVLPSKKRSIAVPSLPVLSWSPASSFIPATAGTQAVEPCFSTSTTPLRDEIVLGGALAAGVGVGLVAGVRVVVGVGVTPPCPPQLISGTSSISASSKAIYLKAIWTLVVNGNLSQGIRFTCYKIHCPGDKPAGLNLNSDSTFSQGKIEK